MSGEVGRPTDYSPEVVAKLIAAFNNGYNITEACDYADINPATYYRWLGAHPEFSVKMERARKMPNRKAKEVLIAALNEGDVNAAKYYLDRRDPDFKSKGELEVYPGSERTEEKIKEFLDDTDDIQDDSATPAGAIEGEVAPAPQDIS